MHKIHQRTDCLPTNPSLANNVIEVLQGWAESRAEKTAYTFLGDDEQERELTYGELDAGARRIAGHLQRLTGPGERALLLLPPGLEFIQSFFGCLYAGVLPVPSCYPKQNGRMPRLTSIAADAKASLLLTTSQTNKQLRMTAADAAWSDTPWVSVDTIEDSASEQWHVPTVNRDDLAFLQYTSGSTSDPKGVMVTHGNLLHNLEAIRRGFGIETDEHGGSDSHAVFWLPAYHDMGLIGGILTPLYIGGHSYLMSPRLFLQRPIRWLSAIAQTKADVSGAPNFAFDLCVDKISQEQRESLDLSSWQIAFCGAEPIRAETLERFAEAFEVSGFRSDSFYPCYGLAESTLLVAGGQGPAKPVSRAISRDAQATSQPEVNGSVDPSETNGQVASGNASRLVCCGTRAYGQKVEIVDPESHNACSDGQVGEIWVQGASNAAGYWNRPDETQRTFGAFLPNGDGPFLRTGDLGFFDNGQLYVTGRLKDMVIVRGRNHYPQDIEWAVSQADEALQTNAGAAFAVSGPAGESLVVVHEIARDHRHGDHAQVARAVRRLLVEEQEIDPSAIILLRPGGLPLTTSGKVQRSLCRQRYECGELKTLHEWINPTYQKSLAGQQSVDHLDTTSQRGTKPLHSFAHVERLAERIEAWLLDWLVERAGVPQEEIHREKPFAEYGLDSLTAVELSHDLESWLHLELTPVLAWNYPTPARLSRYLARQSSGDSTGETSQPETFGLKSVSEFEQLLTEIEAMSEGDVQRALANPTHLKVNTLHD